MKCSLLILLLACGCAHQPVRPLSYADQMHAVLPEMVFCWDHGVLDQEACYRLYWRELGRKKP